MTHTPGPWYAEGSDIGSAENITVGVAIAGRTDDGYISHAQVQANANLMAAAPELLAALRRTVSLLQYASTDGGIHGCNFDEWLEMQPECIAAIAKAEGRSK